MKISYLKRQDDNGYIYNQAISLTKEQVAKLNDSIRSEIALNYPRAKKYVNGNDINTMYLKPLQKNGKYIYLTSTQRIFINLFLKLNLKDRNTYLIIK